MKAVWGIIRSSPIGDNFFAAVKRFNVNSAISGNFISNAKSSNDNFMSIAFSKCSSVSNHWTSRAVLFFCNHSILLMFPTKYPQNMCSFNRSVPFPRPYTHAHLAFPFHGLSWCTIARCTPGLLVPLNNVYAKQVRFLLTDLQNRMFHRAQLHCLLWWLPAICSGVSASIELHKIWKIHFSSWNMDLSGLWKGTQYVEMWNHRLLALSFRMEMLWFELYRHVGGLLVHAWTGL